MGSQLNKPDRSSLRGWHGSREAEPCLTASSLLRLDRSTEERGAGRRRAEDVDPVGMAAEFAGDVAAYVDVVECQVPIEESPVKRPPMIVVAEVENDESTARRQVLECSADRRLPIGTDGQGVGRRCTEDVDRVGMTAESAGNVAVGVGDDRLIGVSCWGDMIGDRSCETDRSHRNVDKCIARYRWPTLRPRTIFDRRGARQ